MEMTPDQVREILKIAQSQFSLETPIGEEDDSHLGDFIEDEVIENSVDYTTRVVLREQLDEVLDTLTDREENVLRLRFGPLDDGKMRTLEDVGKASTSLANVFVRLKLQPSRNCATQAAVNNLKTLLKTKIVNGRA